MGLKKCYFVPVLFFFLPSFLSFFYVYVLLFIYLFIYFSIFFLASKERREKRYMNFDLRIRARNVKHSHIKILEDRIFND